MAPPPPPQRPAFHNIHVSQIVTYRLPLAGLVSILHRISGMLLVVLLPFAIWLFDVSLTSEISYERFVSAVSGPLARLVLLAMVWAGLMHFIAGLRHLWMDATHSVSLQQGRSSALFTLIASTLLTLLLGARLFGLY